jgi:glucose/arabinose dehydrogenase
VRPVPAARRAAVVAIALLVVVPGCSWETADDEIADSADTTLPPTTSIPPEGSDSGEDTGVDDLPDLDGLQLKLATIAEDIDRPIDLAFTPGSRDLWVASKGGEITKVLASENRSGIGYELDWRPTLDLSDVVNDEGNEQGLLGIAIPRDGRYLYASYTDESGALVVDRYTISSTRTTIDDDTRKEILRVPQPAGNHNGGAIRFGPDGFLYVGLGDGGGAGDPDGNGQNTATLLGSILRLEVDTDAAYDIPPGNPFAEGEGAPEIHLYGVRNPWRFSFDRETGDLWIGDVGQDLWEEIDLLPAGAGSGRGANLGWNEREGLEPFSGDSPEGAIDPIHTYGRDDGACSVTGGHVYRGSLVPQLVGTYLYGDYCQGGIRALVLAQGDVVEDRNLEIGIVPNSLGSFGEGPDGEIYVLSLAEGRVLRIEPADAPDEETGTEDAA